ncbi:MAG: NIPSNAP family protein [Bacteroidota bacterium]|nr:NIPSNAP family protein [Bacteroidota bacterium]
MSYKYLFLVFLLATASFAYSKPVKKDFYQIKIYHLKSNEQVTMMDGYLKNVYLPAMHRAGIKNIGVFKPIANDTAASKLVYVFIPFSSSASWMDIDKKLDKDGVYKNAAKSFNEAAADNAPFERMESILLEAFPGQPNLVLPKDKNTDRVFELRSYESPTANLHKKKMAMFNTGSEIEIFNRLGFNPVFYAKVLSGSHMPNFMYMPIFTSVEERNAQWKRFGDDSVWKDISARPENENKVSVSHIDSILMHATDYSDF